MHQKIEISDKNRELAHELRNALSPILLYAQILEVSLTKLSLDNEVKLTQTISEAIKEMDTMIVEKFQISDTSQPPR